MYGAKREVLLRVVCRAQKRWNSTIASAVNISGTRAEEGDATHCLPFSKMPTINGIVRNYIEIAWKGGTRKYHEVGMDRFERLGPAYKETMLGDTIVHLNDPVDIETVFRACNNKSREKCSDRSR